MGFDGFSTVFHGLFNGFEAALSGFESVEFSKLGLCRVFKVLFGVVNRFEAWKGLSLGQIFHVFFLRGACCKVLWGDF